MNRNQILSLALLACASATAQAAQRIDVRDGVAVEAIVASREPTRIRIDGARIVDVVGNIHTNTCQTLAPQAGAPTPSAPAANALVSPTGEFILGCDAAKGEIYVKPVGKSSKPINLFVSSPKATYTLILRRSDLPADTIVLVDKSHPTGRSNIDEPLPPGSERVRTLKTLLLAMAADKMPADARVEDLNQPQRLWAATALTLERVVTWSGWIGERYLLTNTGAAALQLAEQEFDREGERVAAIALEQHELAPGTSTRVYVIRRGD